MIAGIVSILFAIFLIAILALLLPVRIFLKATGGDDVEIHVEGRVMLFAGLLGGGGSYGPGGSYISVHFYRWKILEWNASSLMQRGEKKKSAPKKKKTEKPEKETKEREGGKRSLSDRVGGWRKYARKYSFMGKTALREIRGLLHVDRFHVHVVFGLGDPALTGQIIGVIYAVNGILPERYVIVPGWDFSRRVFSGEADLKLTFRMHLFWIHLVRGFLAYRRYINENRFVPGDSLKAQEV